MAHAYTPGLRVTERAHLRQERRLPLAGTVHVGVGERVSAERVAASTELPGDVQTVNVVQRLGIEASEIREYMLKSEGDAVAAGEIIAESKGLFGLFKSSAAAPAQGTIESVSDVTGQVLIREPPQPVEVTAYVDGTVVEVMPGEGVVVECTGALVQGILGVGGETRGEIKVLVEAPEEPLSADRLDESCAGKVVVGGSHVELAALRRAVEVGVAAVIAGGVQDEDLEAFLGRPLGVAITGEEELGLTLVLTEGFGPVPMAQRTFEILKAREGKQASVNGATQIRAGVIRPEVIVVEEVVGAEEEPPAMGLEVGHTVRIIREPFFGRMAQVTALPEELQEIETEAKVRVLEAELTTGEKMTLPRANVELIQA